MPSKVQTNESLWFIFNCIVHSDLKKVDFHAVAAATKLKTPAARMRYTRLMKEFEQLRDSDHSRPAAMPVQGPDNARKRRKVLSADLHEGIVNTDDVDSDGSQDEKHDKLGMHKQPNRCYMKTNNAKGHPLPEEREPNSV